MHRNALKSTVFPFLLALYWLIFVERSQKEKAEAKTFRIYHKLFQL
jgi:hypothetical protein